jgi:hypothetical protein
MTNAYFGLIGFIFFLIATFEKKKSKLSTYFLIAGIVSLFASFGDYMPVRKFMYDYLPLMNMFRFPAIFRLFFIFSFLIVAGEGLKNFFDNFNKYKFKLTIIFIIITIIFLVIILISLTHTGNIIYDNLYKQSKIQLLLILCYLFAIKLNFSKNREILVLIVIFDMIINTNFNSEFTVYDKTTDCRILYSQQKAISHNLFVLSNENISENTEAKFKIGTLWRNTPIFFNKISAEGNNPYCFKNYQLMIDSYPDFLKTICKNKLIYNSNDIRYIDSIKIDYKKNKYTNKTMYFEKTIFELLKKRNISSKLDTNKTNINITKFSPHYIKFIAETNTNTMLNILQNKYYGWQLKVNGNKREILLSNFNFMSFPIETGKNDIELIYKPDNIIFSFYVSSFIFIISLFSIVIFKKYLLRL